MQTYGVTLLAILLPLLPFQPLQVNSYRPLTSLILKTTPYLFVMLYSHSISPLLMIRLFALSTVSPDPWTVFICVGQIIISFARHAKPCLISPSRSCGSSHASYGYSDFRNSPTVPTVTCTSTSSHPSHSFRNISRSSVSTFSVQPPLNVQPPLSRLSGSTNRFNNPSRPSGAVVLTNRFSKLASSHSSGSQHTSKLSSSHSCGSIQSHHSVQSFDNPSSHRGGTKYTYFHYSRLSGATSTCQPASTTDLGSSNLHASDLSSSACAESTSICTLCGAVCHFTLTAPVGLDGLLCSNCS